jgi:alkaline phosphatase
MFRFLLFGLFVFSLSTGRAQFTSSNAHSHNDYQQADPFFLAYCHHFGSIEADIWEIHGDLFVAHEKEKITPERSLDLLYINPIVELFMQNGGKAWADRSGSFQLLIEIKSELEPTLSLLVQKLKNYPEVFDQKVNRNAVKVVITGHRPKPTQFGNYPDFIKFDGDLTLKYSDQERKRLALYSEDLRLFTSWNGSGNIPEKEQTRLKLIIDSVHSLNCKIRFWDAPDTPLAWQTLMNLKVDFINTDHIQELGKFLMNISSQK